MGSLLFSFWSKYRLGKIFQGKDDDEEVEKIDDLLVSICMDLKGNKSNFGNGSRYG